MKKYSMLLWLIAGFSLTAVASGCTFENAYPLSDYCQSDSDCMSGNVCTSSGVCQPNSGSVGDSGVGQENNDTGVADDVSVQDTGIDDVGSGKDAFHEDVKVDPPDVAEPADVIESVDVAAPDVSTDTEEPECVTGEIEQCVDTNNVCLSSYRACVNRKWSTCKRLAQLPGVTSVGAGNLNENLTVGNLQVFQDVACDAPATNSEMTYIHAGTFYRGQNNVANQPDVAPQREIYLTPYFIDTYEVTRTQYKACMDNQGCETPTGAGYADNCSSQFVFPSDPNKPVACVTFDMARKYCVAQGKRLVTEAEWEKAARGPIANNDKPSRVYPWGNSWTFTRHNRTYPYPNMSNELVRNGKCTYLQQSNDGFCLEAVGTRDNALSYYELFHMAGNVAEYVEDYYQQSYYAGSSNVNPVNKAPVDDNAPRVVRGGSFSEGPMEGTVYYRSVPGSVGTPEAQIGIRCAKDAP